MIDGDPSGCLFGWPRGSIKQWLVALGSVGAMIYVLYAIFSALGWG